MDYLIGVGIGLAGGLVLAYFYGKWAVQKALKAAGVVKQVVADVKKAV